MSTLQTITTPTYPFSSVRDYISYLDNNQMLVKVDEAASNRYLTSAVGMELFAQGGYGFGGSPKAALFERLDGFNGHRASTNLFGHIDFVSTIVGTRRDTLFDDYVSKANKPIQPATVSNANYFENAFKDGDIDLFRLPVETSGKKQGGPVLSQWSSVFLDPETHQHSLGIYRLNLRSRNHMNIVIIPGQRTRMAYLEHVRRGEPMQIAMTNSPPPACTVTSAAKVSPTVSKLAVAGALQGRPMECIKGDHTGLPIPAASEYVMEGEIPIDVLEPEGPYGEFTGYYSTIRDMPVIRLKSMYYRDRPIYNVAAFVGYPNEGVFMGELMLSLANTQTMKGLMNEVVAVRSISSWGLSTVIQVNKKLKSRGTAIRVGSVAAALTPGLKYCIVIDDDVDFWSNDKILWAISTRCAPNRIHILGPLPGWRVDPSERWQSGFPIEEGVRYCAIIDATEPLEPYNEYYKRGLVDVPDSVKREASAILSKGST